MLAKSGFFSPSQSDIEDEDDFKIHTNSLRIENDDYIKDAEESSSYLLSEDQKLNDRADLSQTNSEFQKYGQLFKWNQGYEQIPEEEEKEGERTWDILSRHNKPKKRSVKYLDQLKEHLPQLIYARTDNTCQSLMKPGPGDVWNYFDTVNVMNRCFTKECRKNNEHWIRSEYTEVNFSNPLNFSILNRSTTHALALAWHSDQAPYTIYLELAPKINTRVMNKRDPLSLPFSFNFVMRISKLEKREYSFKVLNCMPQFAKSFVAIRENDGDWRREAMLRSEPISDCWARVDRSVRHRAANWSVMDWKWTPSDENVEGGEMDVEFSLLPLYDCGMLRADLAEWKARFGVGEKFLFSSFLGVPAKYIAIYKGKEIRLNQTKNKPVIILNFWDSQSEKSTLFALRGLMKAMYQRPQKSFDFAKDNIVLLLVIPPFPDIQEKPLVNKVLSRFVKNISSNSTLLAYFDIKSNYDGEKQYAFFEKEVSKPELISEQLLPTSCFSEVVRFFEGYYTIFNPADCR